MKTRATDGRTSTITLTAEWKEEEAGSTDNRTEGLGHEGLGPEPVETIGPARSLRAGGVGC